MKISHIFKSSKGSSIIIFTTVLVVIFGFTSLAVDIGLLASEKAKLAGATDAAALAGAQELLNHSENAINIAKQYLEKNGVQSDNVQINISGDGRSVSILSYSEVEYFFAPVLGLNSGNVNAVAEARIMPVSSVSSEIRPLAIEKQMLQFGEQYVLKEGGGSGSSGNYGALALGGNGASNYRSNIKYGFNGSLKVGDYVDTEPGNMSGPTNKGIDELMSMCNHNPACTFDSYHDDCSRIITVVIVDSLSIAGRTSVMIEGFASFFLEGVAGHGNESIITGRFIKTLGQGELDEAQSDYGIMGIKLIK